MVTKTLKKLEKKQEKILKSQIKKRTILYIIYENIYGYIIINTTYLFLKLFELLNL